jgi:hypothetical protein
MIPTDDLELLQQCKKILASDPFVANLLCERTQLEAIRLSQINYLAKQLEAQKIVSNMSKASSSSAELLLQKFDDIVTNHTDVSYVALIHSSEQGYKLRVPKGRPTKSCTSFGTIDILSIHKSMQINDGQDVLLAFAWTTKKEEELARKFPEVFVMDVTEKTNIEKRGMFIVTGIDGNNKIFIALHCFMPNGYLESYNWIYDYALFPLLVGDDVLRNNQIVITDGEFALYDPLVNLAQTDSPWSGTKHLLCEYHLLEQEWMRYVNPATKSSSEAVELCDKYKKWMVSWFKEYYTESQFKHSFRLFEDHLESSRGILGSACASAINDLWGGLKTKTYKWAFPYKSDKFHLDIIASSMTEAINGGMKQVGPSPLASKTLADSSAVMIHHSNNLERKRELYNSVQVDKTPLWSSSITKHYLTTFAEGIAIHDYDWCREKVIYVQIDEYTWYAADRDYMSTCLSKKLLKRPEYSNVFMVKLNQQTLQHLSCSCHHYISHGMPCVHILPICDGIKHDMFHVRWFKAFNSHLYSKSPAWKDALNQLIKKKKENLEWCYCNDFIPDYDGGVTYSSGASDKDLNNFEKLLVHNRNGIPHMKGQPLLDTNIGIHETCHPTYATFNTDDKGDLSIADVFQEHPAMLSNELGYAKGLAILKEITKCNDVNWNDVVDKMSSILEGVKEKEFQKVACIANTAGNSVQASSLVSSHVPNEHSPKKRRHKAFYEK